MNDKQRILIVGATSGIAEHCARLWAGRSQVELILVVRDAGRGERLAADLRVRGAQARVIAAGFQEPSAIEAALDAAWDKGVDLALVAHGMLPDQENCERDLDACREALAINAVSPVLFAEGIARRMASQRHGTLAVIGSVAGDRGRKSNYVYGAAKGMVERYTQGLRHRFAGSGITVALIKPGPTDTPMTAHLKGSTSLAPVETVAQQIVDALARGQEVIYAPGKWRLIMLVIRHLPAFVFNRMNI